MTMPTLQSPITVTEAYLCFRAKPRYLQTGSSKEWNGIVGSLPRLLTITLVLANQFKTKRVPTHTSYVSEGAFLALYTELLSYTCVKSMTGHF
jgi:hypothetical protein